MLMPGAENCAINPTTTAVVPAAKNNPVIVQRRYAYETIRVQLLASANACAAAIDVAADPLAPAVAVPGVIARDGSLGCDFGSRIGASSSAISRSSCAESGDAPTSDERCFSNRVRSIARPRLNRLDTVPTFRPRISATSGSLHPRR